MSKKEDIIETALNLFNRHNYSSVGVDRIISESGVAKMTFYKYFPSKESLIEECLSRRNKSIQAAIGGCPNQGCSSLGTWSASKYVDASTSEEEVGLSSAT